jgi:rhamnosyltransferase
MSQLLTTVSAVVVCFHPDLEALRLLVGRLLPDVRHVWLVNNGPHPLPGPWPAAVRHIQCPGNIGVAGALNTGFAHAFAEGVDAVIGFDQDSVPCAGLVTRLRDRWNLAVEQQPRRRLAAIGPAMQDRDSGHILLTFAPYNWRRQRLQPQPGQCMEVDHLITSGCLISRQAWQDIGPTNHGLFIDWIDIEWSGRARRAGYQLLMDSDSVMPHRIGQSSRPVGGRRVHIHSPFRHYFLLRNALILWQDKRFPLGWRTHHLLYALRVILANLVLAPDRAQRLAHVAQGWRDGWARRTGAQGRIPC